jgi:hypothetical protein
VLLEYFVVAENVVVDSATNKTSIINVIEELTIPIPQPAPGLPFVAVLPHCSAVMLWRVEAGDDAQDWQVMLRITQPDLSKNEFHVNFRVEPGSRRQRTVMNFIGLSAQGKGDLTFEALLNGQHQANHVVTVLTGPPAILSTSTAV